MKKLYKKFLAWLMGTGFYEYAVKCIIPYIRFSMYYTRLRGVKYHRLYSVLEPGDVLLSLDRKKLTTLLIPGDFSHASMCVSKDGVWEVSEMTHNDYVKSTFFDICKESDRVVVLRCIADDDLVIINAIKNCMSFIGCEYDIEFTLGVKALYCSELVYHSYADNALAADLEDLVGLETPYISPSGLYRAKNLVVVMDSDDLS